MANIDSKSFDDTLIPRPFITNIELDFKDTAIRPSDILDYDESISLRTGDNGSSINQTKSLKVTSNIGFIMNNQQLNSLFAFQDEIKILSFITFSKEMNDKIKSGKFAFNNGLGFSPGYKYDLSKVRNNNSTIVLSDYIQIGQFPIKDAVILKTKTFAEFINSPEYYESPADLLGAVGRRIIMDKFVFKTKYAKKRQFPLTMNSGQDDYTYPDNLSIFSVMAIPISRNIIYSTDKFPKASIYSMVASDIIFRNGSIPQFYSLNTPNGLSWVGSYHIHEGQDLMTGLAMPLPSDPAGTSVSLTKNNSLFSKITILE